MHIDSLFPSNFYLFFKLLLFCFKKNFNNSSIWTCHWSYNIDIDCWWHELCCIPQSPPLVTWRCPDSPWQTLMTRALSPGNWTVPQPRHPVTRTSTGSCCSATNGTAGHTSALWSQCGQCPNRDEAEWNVFCVCLWPTVQGPAAGGETWAEASAGAAQTGAAQRAGDGPAASLRPGDRAAQEAAEAGGGQRCS